MSAAVKDPGLVFRRTAGSGSWIDGSVSGLNEAIERFSQRDQTLHGDHDASTDDRTGGHRAGKKLRRIGAPMRKSKRS